MKVFPVYFLPAFIPFIAFGQTAQQEVNRVFDLFRIILSSSQVLVAIAVTLAFFYFFYNIAIYIRNRGRDGSKGAEEAKEKLLWSVVAIFVLTSIWGIIFFLFRVFIGDSAPGSAAVGDGLPIWSLRLPIDPFTPQNVGPGDRGSPGIDDRGSPGVNDRTGPGIGDRTGGVIDINVGTDTDGIRQQFDAKVVLEGGAAGHWIAERENAGSSPTKYLIRRVNGAEQKGLNRLKADPRYTHFIDNEVLKNPENGKTYTFIVTGRGYTRRDPNDPLQTYEVEDVQTKR